MSVEKTYWSEQGETLNTQHYTKSLYRKYGESVPIRKEGLSDYEMTEEDLIALAEWARGWEDNEKYGGGMIETRKIVVEHPNGYTGILYGQSSMSIQYYGHEVLHSGSRTVNTEAELYDLLRNMPMLIGGLTEEGSDE